VGRLIFTQLGDTDAGGDGGQFRDAARVASRLARSVSASRSDLVMIHLVTALTLVTAVDPVETAPHSGHAAKEGRVLAMTRTDLAGGDGPKFGPR
jgi:hypothetical protein